MFQEVIIPRSSVLRDLSVYRVARLRSERGEPLSPNEFKQAKPRVQHLEQKEELEPKRQRWSNEMRTGCGETRY